MGWADLLVVSSKSFVALATVKSDKSNFVNQSVFFHFKGNMLRSVCSDQCHRDYRGSVSNFQQSDMYKHTEVLGF